MYNPKRAADFPEGHRVSCGCSFRDYEGKGADALAVFYARAVLSSPLFEAGCKLAARVHEGTDLSRWDAAVKELREIGAAEWR